MGREPDGLDRGELEAWRILNETPQEHQDRLFGNFLKIGLTAFGLIGAGTGMSLISQYNKYSLYFPQFPSL